MKKPRLIVASARLPVTLSRRGESWEVLTSTGGLVTALKSVAERRPFTWIGWPGMHVAESERAAAINELARHGSIPVFISKALIEGFYESFSNRVLWPLFHNLAERQRFDPGGWRTYQQVNEMFAEAICDVAGPGDVVWVHDYQLALVPELLRRRRVGCPVGFFLHIPFPASETYRTLPAREAILQGMLGADLIGFHAYEYVSHFRTACLRLLAIESEPEEIRVASRRIQLAVLPIGIDPAEIREMADSRAARQELATLQATYAGKHIIIGVDRLDYTKGIPEKLLAMEELLRTHPGWRQRVVLVQIAAPSRTGVDEYRQLKRDVDELVGRINGRFGSPSSVPIIYINQAVPRERLVGMYQAADIALVTPVRDGMNLVALEYVAARADRGGTLILSEFTGAAHCLPGARLVNPFNVAGVAAALAEALEAEQPNMEAFRHMLHFVNENTSVVWANRFLDRLEAAAREQRPEAVLLKLTEQPLLDRIRKAERPLVLLDYDGTLRSFVRDPNQAAPDARLLGVLRDLAETTTLFIISGRSAERLDAWLGALPVGLICEHGLALKEPGGQWEQRVNVTGASVLRTVQPLLQDFVRRTPGSAIEIKKAAVAWHYRGADPEFGGFQAKELAMYLEDRLKRRPFSVLRGNRVIEVRHQNVTKGKAVLEVLKRNGQADLLFCAGDDRTDEEMVEAIPESWRSRAIICWVGAPHARADYWVDSAAELIDQLEVLARVYKGRSPRRTGAGEGARNRTRHVGKPED